MNITTTVSSAEVRPYQVNPAQSLIENIEKKTELFRQGRGHWITPNCQHITDGSIHYYGIHKNAQDKDSSGNPLSIEKIRELYHQEIKAHLLQNMQMPADAEVVQVVGDSASFSRRGTSQAKYYLARQLQENNVVLYGYTGHEDANGNRCVNAAVSDVLAEKRMLAQAIGNLVAFHTPTALTTWGCTGPNLQHYVIVYGDDDSKRETGTVFGDDVITSDFMADRLIMLEGGVQSFLQACNALRLGQRISILNDLRSEEKGFCLEFAGVSHMDMYGRPNEIQTPYFASSRFLKEVEKLVAQHPAEKIEEVLQKWYRSYFGKGKCYLADPKRGDYDTKQKLMDQAWKLFMEEKLYLKIPELVNRF